MKLGAKLYISAVCVVGALGLAGSLIGNSVPDLLRLAAYAAVTMVAASLKVRLPGIQGTMSASYVFILIGIVNMGAAEAVFIGVLAHLVQSLWKAKRRPGFSVLAFNTASAIIAVLASYRVYHNGFSGSSVVARMAATGCVYFVVNTVLVAGVVSFTEGKRLFGVWRDSYFWSFPYYLVGASIATVLTYLTKFFVWELTLLVLPLAYIIYRSYQLYLDRLEREKTYAEEMASLHLRTIEALALAIEAKDQTTGEHLRRVQVYAREIGKDLGLKDKEMTALQAASILHDIGKLAVPDYIISKPGRLTPEEFEKMKIHPVVGAEILETISFPYPVVPIVRAHHEKWDGSGYPYGLKGEDIPIGARILTCVDCFDALASDRQYRRALPPEEALKIVNSEKGKSFDPSVVEILVRRYKELEELAGQEPMDEPKRLSRHMKVERGLAPDAGFEEVHETEPARQTSNPVSSMASARQELQALYEVLQTLGNSLSLTETLSVVAARLRTLIPYDGIAIYLRDENTLKPAYVTGENYSLFNSLQIPLGQGLSGWVAENHKPILNGNPSVESGYLNDPMKFSMLRSALSAPLEGLGGCVGVVTLYASAKDAFSRENLRILLAISAKMSVAIENAQSYQKSGHEGKVDALTGLPNAASLFGQLETELARAQQSGAELTVLVFDLDGFKQVNDQFGHVTGDKVLTEVARTLKAACRGSDFIGRMGGDEFVALLPGLSASGIDARVEAFRSSIARAGVGTGVSVGAASYPKEGENPEVLLAIADRNMYRTKQERKGLPSIPAGNLINLAKSLSNSLPEDTLAILPQVEQSEV